MRWRHGLKAVALAAVPTIPLFGDVAAAQSIREQLAELRASGASGERTGPNLVLRDYFGRSRMVGSGEGIGYGRPLPNSVDSIRCTFGAIKPIPHGCRVAGMASLF